MKRGDWQEEGEEEKAGEAEGEEAVPYEVIEVKEAAGECVVWEAEWTRTGMSQEISVDLTMVLVGDRDNSAVAEEEEVRDAVESTFGWTEKGLCDSFFLSGEFVVTFWIPLLLSNWWGCVLLGRRDGNELKIGRLWGGDWVTEEDGASEVTDDDVEMEEKDDEEEGIAVIDAEGKEDDGVELEAAEEEEECSEWGESSDEESAIKSTSIANSECPRSSAAVGLIRGFVAVHAVTKLFIFSEHRSSGSGRNCWNESCDKCIDNALDETETNGCVPVRSSSAVIPKDQTSDFRLGCEGFVISSGAVQGVIIRILFWLIACGKDKRRLIPKHDSKTSPVLDIIICEALRASYLLPKVWR